MVMVHFVWIFVHINKRRKTCSHVQLITGSMHQIANKMKYDAYLGKETQFKADNNQYTQTT